MTEKRDEEGRLVVEEMPADCGNYHLRVPIKAVQINEPFTFKTNVGMFKAKAGDYFIEIENQLQCTIYNLSIGFHAMDEKLFASMYGEVVPEVKKKAYKGEPEVETK